MKATMMEYPLTLVHLLERAGEQFGAAEIVSRMPDKSLHRHTYGDFYRRTRALAESLQKAGLKRGERVGTLMWNHYAHLEAYFGIPVAGGVLHTLNIRLHPSEIAYIINHAEDRFLIVDDILLPLYEAIKSQVKVERVFVVPLTGQPIPEGYENYESLLEEATGEFTYPELEENEPAGMCYTSGTTGQPKGVVYSHRSTILHSFASALPDALGVSQADTVCAVVPMFHVNAWGLPFTCTMIGVKQVFPGPHLDPVSLLDLYEAEKVGMTAGIPTIWLGILQALNKFPGKWSLVDNLRLVVGGSAAPESLIRGLDKHGLEVRHCWGMTETSPLGSGAIIKPHLIENDEDKIYQLRATQGYSVAFVDTRIRVEDKVQPWDGESIGELEVRGPWIAASYYNHPGSEHSWSEDGWFKTGDMATIDKDGYINIVDRTKDLIKSGGEWISSVALENTLMGHPDIAEAAAIGVPHPKWQERPLVVAVPAEGKKPTVEELNDYLSTKFESWMIPDAYVFVDEIPRSSAGKFLKRALREQYKNWNWE
ncbi:long-chain fatty acid--CoA ligase [Mechercharimyces sp. CAU 1602]|uniref:long-chain fatty acid--CoA ligase n=1 Tax=Mechercharimyces sp. CAU 1602 TaxID=2973933 RepID=UPI0021631CE9|nr:long-chain fatty acid--CoA ligase [Mechercharimyces sp. CAU 1602]MCS1351806.1 long-chain fatty acid--CoA ligase [Mechercharimyces sp. CAU 1602]